MKVEVIKNGFPYVSTPWHIYVDGRCMTYRGHKTKKEAVACVEATGNTCTIGKVDSKGHYVNGGVK